MRYDSVIIGGGLSALMCGIELARNGKKTALVAAGQSCLHFSSSSWGLYKGEEPLKAIAELPQHHPYAKVGVERVEVLAGVAKELLNIAGVSTEGSAERNHYIMTPIGSMRQCWLSLEGALSSENPLPEFKSAAVYLFDGFLDSYSQFIIDALKGWGISVEVHTFSLPEFEQRRNNPTELRSVHIARVFDKQENIDALTHNIMREVGDVDAVILPSVFGFCHQNIRERVERATGYKTYVVATMSPSVEGVKVERALRRTFEEMGGTIFNGHRAVSYTTNEQGEIASITTSKDITLTAENFVLASGSFIGKGLEASRQGVIEPLFGADIDMVEQVLVDRNIYNAQPFMRCGVATDNLFNIFKGGVTVANLYGCGSVLSGCDPVKEGCGGGVAMITALSVAQTIINR